MAVESWRRECNQKEIKIVYKALIFNVQQIYVLGACAATCKDAEEECLNTEGSIIKIFITELKFMTYYQINENLRFKNSKPVLF